MRRPLIAAGMLAGLLILMLVSLSSGRSLPETRPITVTDGHEGESDLADAPTLSGQATASTHASAPTSLGSGDGFIDVEVVDADGAPLAGAPVLLRRAEESDPELSAISDSEGTLRFEGLPWGRYSLEVADQPGLAGEHRTLEVSEENPAHELRVHCLRAGAVELVVRHGGEPAPGALVALHGTHVGDHLDKTWDWSAEVVADADGNVRVESAPTGALRARVQAPGASALHLFDRLAYSEEPWVIDIPRGACTLRFEVRDEEGVLIEGARILAMLESEAGGHSGTHLDGTTDARGEAEWRGLAEHRVAIAVVEAEGFDTWRLGEARNLVITAGAPHTESLTLRRSVSGSVSGRITSAEKGEALAGARVALARWGRLQFPWGEAPEAVSTDAEGRYRIEGVGRGRWIVLATHDDHPLPIEADALARPRVSPTARQWPMNHGVRIDHLQDAAIKDLALPDGVVLPGIVLDADDLPVVGASVEVDATDLTEFLREQRVLALADALLPTAVTDSQGRFWLRGLTAGARVRLRAHHDQQGRAESESLVLPAKGQAPLLVLRVARTGSYAGRIVDERGKPLSGSSLTLARTEAPWTEQPAKARSNADGTFSFTELMPGGYRIRAVQDGWTILSHADLVLVVEEGKQRANELVVARRVASIWGHVTDPGGEALADVHIEALSDEGIVVATAESDRRGQYVLEVPDGPTHGLRAEGELIRKVAAPYGRVDFTAGSVRHSLQVTVLGPDGEPISHATCFVSSERMDLGRDLWRQAAAQADTEARCS